MKDILNIVLCQYAMEWEAPSRNLARLGRLIDAFVDQAAGDASPDLVVLPEFFATGFTSDVSLAEDGGGQSLAWMRRKASATGSAIVGSLPVAEGGHVYNRMYFVCPDGYTEYYDKRHLFRMSGENALITPGTLRRVVQYMGWRIGLNVCYDLRFPVWSRNTGDTPYDMMVNVASWPASRSRVAGILSQARAIENQAYFVFCNRVGESPEDSYDGHSGVFDYKGEQIGGSIRCGDMCGDERFVCASVSRSALLRFREKFPAWMDADRFEL
ncbi:MAG TPA: nitrilase family protein [Candidatus Coprenecus pullistercoris]|nr:nitrilase family protein [Candidatus Coprenecus pullistercoris]